MTDETAKLHVAPELEEDLVGFTDDGFVLLDFFTLAWGSESGRGPQYARAARTVWRVMGDGEPQPEVDCFDWGGEHLSVPDLRIWYIRSGEGPPIGIGAFEAGSDADTPERGKLEVRIRARFGAGAWLETV